MARRRSTRTRALISSSVDRTGRARERKPRRRNRLPVKRKRKRQRKRMGKGTRRKGMARKLATERRWKRAGNEQRHLDKP